MHSERTPIRIGSIEIELVPSEPIRFGSFVDCNMASAWVGETFRIFPGKYGEDPVWGAADDLRFAEGTRVSEVFRSTEFTSVTLPPNALPGQEGLHGAVWFESIYQSPTDPRQLYALYHNENYPETLPFDPATGEGYRDADWPPGLQGEESIQAVPRIGIMRSTDGGASWVDRGILQDHDERMIRTPVNVNYCFPGGVGDPSAVACGDHLYVFYGEYAYPGPWSAQTWTAKREASGQCVSVARIALGELDHPTGAARRWDGEAFAGAWDGVGHPIPSLQIPEADGGGPVSRGDARFYWGPSVSWNEDLECWLMLLGRVDGPFWVGDRLFASINVHRDLGEGDNSQQWSTPVEILHKPGHTLWYPAMQPMDTPEDLARQRTGVRLGARGRLFYKEFTPEGDSYRSEYVIELRRNGAQAGAAD